MKVIVSDFDGTFYNEDYRENIRLINNFVNEGNIFIIATGRPIYLLKDALDKSIKYSYLICNDGAVIFDNNDKKIFDLNLDVDIAKDIYSFLDSNKQIKEVYVDSEYGFSNSFDGPCNGIIAKPIFREVANDIVNTIKERYPSINVYFSHTWINILNKDASKGNAIKKIASLNNLDVDSIVTAGDSVNDISMMDDFDSCYIKSDENYPLKAKHNYSSFKEMIDDIERRND